MLLPTVCHVLIFLNVFSPVTMISPQSTSVLSSSNTNTPYPSFLYPTSRSTREGEHRTFITHRQNELKNLLNDIMWLNESSRTVLYQWLLKKCNDLRKDSDSYIQGMNRKWFINRLDIGEYPHSIYCMDNIALSYVEWNGWIATCFIPVDQITYSLSAATRATWLIFTIDSVQAYNAYNQVHLFDQSAYSCYSYW